MKLFSPWSWQTHVSSLRWPLSGNYAPKRNLLKVGCTFQVQLSISWLFHKQFIWSQCRFLLLLHSNVRNTTSCSFWIVECFKPWGTKNPRTPVWPFSIYYLPCFDLRMIPCSLQGEPTMQPQCHTPKLCFLFVATGYVYNSVVIFHTNVMNFKPSMIIKCVNISTSRI